MHKVLFVPSKSLFPQSCLSSGSYGGVNDDLLLQEGLRHAQVFTQSPCPCGSPLLTHTSTGDTQIQFCFSLCGVSGSWYGQDLFEPSEHLLVLGICNLIIKKLFELYLITPIYST